MEVYWGSEKLKNQLEDINYLTSNFGEKGAEKVIQRINELIAAPTYIDIPHNANKHSIGKGKGFKYFVVDLPTDKKGRGKWRLQFIPVGEFDPANQKTIKSIKITGIVDYH